MKIGKLEFKEWAAKKPLSLSASGEFLKAEELAGVSSLGVGSLHALAPEKQLKLAVERYKLEPDFKLGIIGIGIKTRDEIIEEMERESEFGRLAINVEMDYCNHLIGTLAGGITPAWPKPPIKPIPTWPDWKPVKKCIWLKVRTRALFCENTTDNVTGPFATYRINNVHPVFATRGFTVTKLTGTDDDRVRFVPLAKNSLTGYIGGIGHGAYTLYTGHAGNRILEVGMYDPAEVGGKAMHFLSCQTARTLGPDTVANGARCYLGYDENFTFVWDDGGTPVNEFLLFAKADSIIDITMANGGTAQQAYDAAVQAFNAGMAQVPGSAAATWLKYDRDHLRLLGNPATTVLPYRYIKMCFPLPIARQEALANAGELAEA